MKKTMNLRYLTHEGIKNIGINRLMSLASVAVLMSCLVMIGSAFMLFLNVDSLLKNIQAQNVIMVFADLDADDATVAQLKENIGKLDNIASIDFVPKEDAYKQVISSLGDNASILSGVDDSFLPDGFKVTVSDMEFFTKTVNDIRGLPNVYSIQQNSDLAARLEKIRTAVSYISMGIVILLLIVAIFIIANTIKITMFSRKLEISIMKAVGATNSFIRWPFLVEGVTLGILAAILAWGILYGLYALTGEALLTIFGVLGGSLVSFWDYAVYIGIAFVVVSIIAGGFGSIISIGKYLKEQGSVVLDDDV
ncbi:MAG: permease-like cell division protein FtsX [Oscillospiraceae bacterium]|nr:permease-like cell division protein FtsX [Oscillospiraceae bacterium]